MGWMQRPNGDLVTAGERHPYQLSVPLAGAQLDTDDTHLPGDCAGPDVCHGLNLLQCNSKTGL